MKRKHAGQIEIPLPGAIGFAHDPAETFAAEYGREKMEAERAAYTRWERFDYAGGLTIWQRECPDCDHGLLLAPVRYCPRCEGSGYLTRDEARGELRGDDERDGVPHT